MFWIWSQIPASEIGPAQGPFPASLMPPPPAVLPWQRRGERDLREREREFTTQVQAPRAGGVSLSLRGGWQGVLNFVQGLAAAVVGVTTGQPLVAVRGIQAVIVSVQTTRRADMGGLAMPERDPLEGWESLPEYGGTEEETGEKRRLTTGGGVVVSGAGGEQYVVVETVQGQKVIEVQAAIPMGTDSGGGGTPPPSPVEEERDGGDPYEPPPEPVKGDPWYPGGPPVAA